MRLPFTRAVPQSANRGFGAESLISAFFADAPELMGIVELLGDDIRHLADNAAAERFFGVLPGGTANRLASEMGVPADVLATWVDRFCECQRTGQTVQFEYAHPTPEGTRYFLVNVSPLSADPGAPPRFRYIVEDVTERNERPEEETRREQERYERLFNVVREGFAHYRAVYDDAGKLVDLVVLEINPAGAQLSGVAPEDQIGKTWRHVWPGVDTSLFALYQRVDETGENVRFDDDNGLTGRTYDVVISRVAPGEFVVTFSDITERKQGEEALRNAAEILDLGDAFLEVDRNWRIIRVNANQEKLSQTPRTESLGRVFWEVWPDIPIDSQYWREYHRCMENRVPVQFEDYFGPLDIWTDVRAYPTSKGGMAVFFYDATDRKRTEAALRESEEKFATAFQASPDALVISGVSDGTIREVNEAFVELFGYSREEVIGHSSLELDMFVDPAQREGVLEQLRQAGFVRDHEVRIRRRSGEERDVSLTVEAMQMGGEAMMLTIVRDITERKRTEAALRESEARRRAIFESLVEGVVFLNTEGQVVEANEAVELRHGHTLQELADPGLDPRGRIVRGDGSPFPEAEQPAMVALRTGEAVRDVEMGVPTRDGRIRWRLVNAQPVRDDEGQFLGVAASFFDITERKRMEDELRERADALERADRAKDEFLAMLGHELRNPLAAISNATHVLRLTGQGDSRLDRSIGVLSRQVQHMARLVDDLLDVARIIQGRLDLKPQLVDLSEVTHRAVESVQPLVHARGHELRVSVPPMPVWIVSDPDRMAQIIGNLLNNAAKYTQPNGRIELSVECEAGEAIIRVKDNGPGIGEDILPFIFDLFQQGPRSLARSEGGLGIGLTLVKRLAELHGGAVEARSRRGEGSEFIVRLPAYEGMSEAESEPVETTEGVSHRALRILVVEDNTDAGRMLADILTAWGHNVTLAPDGATAMQIATRDRPDIVLLDIGLPGMDGYEVIRRLRHHAGLEKTRVVALTGYGQDEDKRRTRDAGFDEHLVKPVNLAQLQSVLSIAGR